METGALQALFNQNSSQQIKTASLRPGQIIHGKIIKLYPGQMAEVRIGSQKMIAQLEAALSANERYWFQVQTGEGKVHLKVIASGADEGRQTDNLTRVLGEFSIPPTKENIEMVRYFIKEQLPINSEILQQASDWLRGANPRSAGMEAVKMLLTRGLPLTLATYSALYTANKDQSLILLMDNLLKALDSGSQTETTTKVKNLLNEMIPSNKVMTSGQALSQLLITWLKSQDEEGQAAFKLLQQFGAFPGQSDENEALQLTLKALQKSELTSDELPHEWKMARNVLSLMDKGNSSEAKQLINNIASGKIRSDYPNPVSINDMAKSLKLLIAGAPGSELNKQESLLAFKQLLVTIYNGTSDPSSLERGFSNLISERANLVNARLELEKIVGDGFGQNKMPGITGKNEELLARILVQAEHAITSYDAGTPVLPSAKIKEFLTVLGLSHEQQLADAFNGTTDAKLLPADTLKLHLMRLLGEQPPQSVKEAAEQLLNKITGFQVLSQETGPIQQLIVQVPFFLGGKMNEVTMQWSGKKAEDGKIDADFCRVLFYLKLEHIEDTIVDMQVQNRVMSIQVINDHPLLKKISTQLLPILKDNLAKIDYHLSSLNFGVPNSAQLGKESKKLADLYSKKEYSRVDIKI